MKNRCATIYNAPVNRSQANPVAMAIYSVLLTLVTADFASGAGPFDLLRRGSVSHGLGGVLSHSVFGWIAIGLSSDAAAGSLSF